MQPAAARVDGHTAPDPRLRLARLVGLATIAFTTVYLASDVLETIQGGFTTERLLLTYAGESAIPLFVLGLYAVQRPFIGRLGLLGATAYAYSYVFFTSTVVYAVIDRTANYADLATAFGVWMTLHGCVMVIGGITFGIAVMRAEVFPRWTGICLGAGVCLVAAATGLPTVARTFAEAVVAAAFIGMGATLLSLERTHD
jgi:hypothetical protein